MVNGLWKEQWKAVQFDIEFTNEFTLEVSNWGRLRTFNKVSNGNIIKGSVTEGYRIVRLKLYKPREKKIQKQFDEFQQEISLLFQKKKELKKKGNERAIETLTTTILSKKKSLSKKFQADLKRRTINYHCLIHRLVATYFLRTPTPDKTVVAHLDFNKLNNRVENLKWMTPEENREHQNNSPHVIKEISQRKYTQRDRKSSAKLTVTKVMLLKKLLKQEKPMKQLVKLFKITETQILRIKRGENWGEVPAAE